MVKRRRGRRRGLLRPHLDRRARDARSAWCRSGTPTASRASAGNRGRGAGRRARAARCAAGSAWTSSSSTSATTRPEAGDDVVLFGPGDDGEPTAQDWAEACGTISYEIVTRIGGRMSARYVDTESDAERRRPMSRGRTDRRGRRRCGGRGRRGRRGRRRAAAAGRSRPRVADDDARSAACARDPITVVADDGVAAARRGRRARAAADADGRRGRRKAGEAPPLTVVFATASRSTWTAGTSSARPTAAWCARSSTTSARTAAPAASGASNATIDQLGHDLLRGPRRRRARRAGRAGRPLDGRHDDHGAGRAAPGAVRRPGRRRRR